MTIQNQRSTTYTRKPSWLRQRLPTGATYEKVRASLKKRRLHTVCQEAKCPNLWECFSRETATFLIMGSHCTRKCQFCSVGHGPLSLPDPDEPAKVAEAARDMGLGYVVITSVTRDDLPDGGAGFFAETIKELRKNIQEVFVEILIPDFQGDKAALQTVLEARPDVLNHNIETVPRLYPVVRPEADYRRSLECLRWAKQYAPAIPTKSGLMLGLGELAEEVNKTLRELLEVGCGMLTLGQYLQPTREHLPVDRFIHPKEFDNWKETALGMGFSQVASGPFVRSSYHAKELYHASEI